MNFGVTQWFVSILIFVIVLAVMIWAAVHLGKKEKTFNVLAIVLQFPPEKRGYGRFRKRKKEGETAVSNSDLFYNSHLWASFISAIYSHAFCQI